MTDIQTSAGGQFRDGAKPPLVPQPQRSTEAGTLARLWALALDGAHDWGSVDVSPTRHGVTRYRLVLFPPGIDTVERRLLRAWRAWPTCGAALWLVSEIVLGIFLTPGVALALSIGAYLACGAVLFARVAAIRVRVRTLSVVRMAGYPDEESAARLAKMKSIVAALRYADAQRAEGHWSQTDHEAAWWRVYDRLDQNQPR